MTRTYRSASSGWISGVGFAIANTMGSRAMRLRSRTLRIPGTLRPMKTSAPSTASPRPPGGRVGVRAGGHRALHEIHPQRPRPVDDAVLVDADDVAHAARLENLDRRRSGRTDTGDHDPDPADGLTDQAERIEDRGEDDHRRPVLIVVEHRDVEFLAQALLDLEAARGRDVLQVDPAERGRDELDALDDLVD